MERTIKIAVLLAALSLLASIWVLIRPAEAAVRMPYITTQILYH